MSLNSRLIAWSQNWKAVFLLFALQMISFGALFALETEFVRQSGFQTFDFQNGLTLAQLEEQLTTYGKTERQLYAAFTAVDFIFPLLSGLFYSVIYALFLRLNHTKLAQMLLARGACLLPLLITTADWLENFAFANIVMFGDSAGVWLADAGLIFKQLKLLGITLGSAGMALLGVWLALTIVYQQISNRFHPNRINQQNREQYKKGSLS
ncbi:MAG: hypothetical protein SF123_15095 [Chloroflexota bacterium]|nr:hypothetical protein [Chloroflexota bacterium]